MSISSIVSRNSFFELGEKLGFEWKEHEHEIIVGAIMTAVSIAMAVALTGDFNQAFARPARH